MLSGLFRLFLTALFFASTASWASAACTIVGDVPTVEEGSDYPYAIKLHCVANDTNTVAAFGITPFAGYFMGADIAFTAGKEPTSVTPTVTTYTGSVTVMTGSAVTSAATGRNKTDTPEPLYDGLKLTQVVTCDATDEWDVYLIFMSNK